MDLNDLKPKSDTVEVILMHPSTGDPLTKADGTEMSITVYGTHSKVYRAVDFEQKNKYLQKARKQRKIDIKAEDIESNGLEVLSKLVKEWDIVISGKCPELTVDNAMNLFRDYPWIKDQVEEAISDTNSFMKA